MSDHVLGLRLLMIGDNLAFCRLTKRIAEQNGFDVTVTDDPDHFITAQSWNPTLIVLDLQMPEKDGIELLRDLSLNRCSAQIVLTSGLDRRTLDAALRLGTERGLSMNGILQKPATLEDLQDLLIRNMPPAALLSGHLSEAIVAEQLFLEYQPKIDCRLGRIVGAEALVRWRHPSLGVILPEQFIGLAEESDLIDPLTAWVFSTAAKQAAAWQQQGLTLEMAINISARNLRDIQLPDRLARQCADFGINPTSLTLELTETSAMHDAVHMIDVLTRLRVKGFKLSVDDFGTGYSSLRLLARLPVDTLKVDRSFIQSIADTPNVATLVTTIVSLARAFNMHTVAEGVETSRQLEILRAMKCDEAQGYLFGRPTPASEVAAVIARLSQKTR